jgi:hypothetical protein
LGGDSAKRTYGNAVVEFADGQVLMQ